MVHRAIAKVPGLRDTIQRAVPMGRLAHAEEVAEAVIFLAGVKASFITDSALVIDGGLTTTCHV